MLAITLHDLRFRRRQFMIAIIGAALVFAMALLLSGLAQSFRDEVRRTVAAVGVDTWIVNKGATGPFTGLSPMATSDVAVVAALPGVRDAQPLLVVPQSVKVGTSTTPRGTTMIGYQPGHPGQPPVHQGRPAQVTGEAVVGDLLGAHIGDDLEISGHHLTVTGIGRGLSLFGGLPGVYVTLDQAQAIVFSGEPKVSVIVTRGTPSSMDPRFAAMSNSEVRDDTLRPVRDAFDSIDNTRLLMWLVAAVIVAALVYVSTLERVRDFAVLKSLGASSASVFLGVAFEAVIVSLFAAGVATVLSGFLRPVFALPVAIPLEAFVVLPLAAIGVGVLSSLVALRRAISIDPAYAFAGPG
jgi:putative ABC transport system permease protein